MPVNYFNDLNLWEESAVEFILAQILDKRKIDESKVFNLALAGGSTPFAIYKKLRLKLQELSIESSVSIFLTDERDVPLNHKESNGTKIFGLFRECAHILNPSEEDCLNKYVKQIEGQLSRGSGEFDLVVLGMGEDGHFASIFPHHNIDESEDLVYFKQYIDKLKMFRYSLSWTKVLNSEQILVLFRDNQVKEAILKSLEKVEKRELPIEKLVDLRKKPIFWYVKHQHDKNHIF